MLVSTDTPVVSRDQIADIVRMELNAEETHLSLENEDLLRQMKELDAKLKRVAADREAIRLTRIRMFRRYIEQDEFTIDPAIVAEKIVDDERLALADALAAKDDPTVLNQAEAEAMFGEGAGDPPDPDPEPDDPEPEPLPPAADEQAPRQTGGAARADQLRAQGDANRKIVDDAAKELGVFTNRRLAERIGSLTLPTVGDYVRRLIADGRVYRGSEQERGTKVYFVHTEYEGEHSFEQAAGEQPPTASEDDISRVRDWVIEKGAGSSFVSLNVSDALGIRPAVALAALNVLCVRGIVKGKKGGRYEYVPPTRRAA